MSCLTRFRTVKLSSAKKYIITLLCSLVFLCASSIPDKPAEERLVNDFAGLLSENVAVALEDSLVRVSQRTSTQILVLTVNSLEGYDPSQFAYEVGEKWGVGSKKHNNGVVILVKPKTADSQGRAFIATGYGLEGCLPDIICGRIVNNVMIPYFKENNYESGIVAGAYEVVKYVDGEYKADPAAEEIDWVTIIIILGIIGLFLYVVAKSDGGNNNRRNNHITYSNDSFIFGGKNYRGGGGFGGGFGSSGGFGGFGGGHFGGGGGGGRW